MNLNNIMIAYVAICLIMYAVHMKMLNIVKVKIFLLTKWS